MIMFKLIEPFISERVRGWFWMILAFFDASPSHPLKRKSIIQEFNPGSGTAPAVMETHVKYIQIFSKQGLNLYM